MGRNFDDYPGFQPFRSWANTYAQDCINDFGGETTFRFVKLAPSYFLID